MKDDYFAVGTGAIAALVAMDRGADLVEAVEAAIRRDGNSGGPIDVLTLDADT
jgi:20S proteasome alpha/beta subunit